MAVSELEPGQSGSGITQAVPEGFYTTSQAADLIGRSADTLRRWRAGDKPLFKPSRYRKFGQTNVALYSEADIKKGRKIAAAQKPGRKAGK